MFMLVITSRFFSFFLVLSIKYTYLTRRPVMTDRNEQGVYGHLGNSGSCSLTVAGEGQVGKGEQLVTGEGSFDRLVLILLQLQQHCVRVRLWER